MSLRDFAVVAALLGFFTYFAARLYLAKDTPVPCSDYRLAPLSQVPARCLRFERSRKSPDDNTLYVIVVDESAP